MASERSEFYTGIAVSFALHMFLAVAASSLSLSTPPASVPGPRVVEISLVDEPSPQRTKLERAPDDATQAPLDTAAAIQSGPAGRSIPSRVVMPPQDAPVETPPPDRRQPRARHLVSVALPPTLEEDNPDAPALASASVRPTHRAPRPDEGIAPGETQTINPLPGLPLAGESIAGDAQGVDHHSVLTSPDVATDAQGQLARPTHSSMLTGTSNPAPPTPDSRPAHDARLPQTKRADRSMAGVPRGAEVARAGGVLRPGTRTGRALGNAAPSQAPPQPSNARQDASNVSEAPSAPAITGQQDNRSVDASSLSAGPAGAARAVAASGAHDAGPAGQDPPLQVWLSTPRDLPDRNPPEAPPNARPDSPQGAATPSPGETQPRAQVSGSSQPLEASTLPTGTPPPAPPPDRRIAQVPRQLSRTDSRAQGVTNGPQQRKARADAHDEGRIRPGPGTDDRRKTPAPRYAPHPRQPTAGHTAASARPSAGQKAAARSTPGQIEARPESQTGSLVASIRPDEQNSPVDVAARIARRQVSWERSLQASMKEAWQKAAAARSATPERDTRTVAPEQDARPPTTDRDIRTATQEKDARPPATDGSAEPPARPAVPVTAQRLPMSAPPAGQRPPQGDLVSPALPRPLERQAAAPAEQAHTSPSSAPALRPPSTTVPSTHTQAAERTAPAPHPLESRQGPPASPPPAEAAGSRPGAQQQALSTAEATELTPTRPLPGLEGGAPIMDTKPGAGGMASAGEESARPQHSAEMAVFFKDAGLNPREIDPGEVLDLDAKKSEYWEYLEQIQEQLVREFGKFSEEQSEFLTGWVELMFEIDKRGRVVRSHIWVKRRPGPGKESMVRIAEETVLNAEPFPEIPATYRRSRFFLLARFNFGAIYEREGGIHKRSR